MAFTILKKHFSSFRDDIGTQFVTTLIALISALAVLCCAALIQLAKLEKRWSNSLQGHITIEVPALREDGSFRSLDQVIVMSQQVREKLQAVEVIKEIKAYTKEELAALIAPWAGEEALLDNLPIPGMVSITLHSNTTTEQALPAIIKVLGTVSRDLRLDVNDRWARDIQRLASLLTLISAVIALALIFSIVMTVAGSVKARLANQAAEIDLLHLMGASDEYIIRQFQIHVLKLVSLASSGGLIVGLAVLAGIGWFLNRIELELLNNVGWSILQWTIILALPVMICLLSWFVAKITVSNALKTMP